MPSNPAALTRSEAATVSAWICAMSAAVASSGTGVVLPPGT